MSSVRARLGWVFRHLAPALGLAGILASDGSAALAAPEAVSLQAPPVTWIAYASRVNQRVLEWLASNDEPAVRLRAYVNATRPAPDQSSRPVMLTLWVGNSGTIERVRFVPFAHEAANSDLRALIVGRTIGAPPPPDMVQPLRLSIQLDPQATGDAGAAI